MNHSYLLTDECLQIRQGEIQFAVDLHTHTHTHTHGDGTVMIQRWYSDRYSDGTGTAHRELEVVLSSPDEGRVHALI